MVWTSLLLRPASLATFALLLLVTFRGAAWHFTRKLTVIQLVHHFRKGFPASTMEFSIIRDCGEAKHENGIHSWIHHKHDVGAFPRMCRRKFFLDTHLLDEIVGGIVGGDTSLFNGVRGFRLLFHDNLKMLGGTLDLGESVQGLALGNHGGCLVLMGGARLEDGVGDIWLFTRAFRGCNHSTCRRILHYHGVILGRLDHEVMVRDLRTALKNAVYLLCRIEPSLEHKTSWSDARCKNVEPVHL